MTDTTEPESDSDSDDSVNISRLRQMAIRGRNYRETIDFENYYGMDIDEPLYVGPLPDPIFLPIAGVLEDRMDMDVEEAQEKLEEGEDPDGRIDPGQFDEEFVAILQDAAAHGIDTSQGLAEGEDQEGVREILAMLSGGLTLVIAKKVLELSSDAEAAEKFRRGGGGE